MSTQELDKMLHEELQKETMDDELIRQILDVLESRESDYQEEYSPAVIEASKKLERIGCMPTPKRNKPRVLKAASILLVVGLLLFTLPRVAHAENLLELFARWTESVFEFFDPSDPHDQPEYVFETDHPGLQQIYDAVVELGVTDPVVPMWVPDGYELVEMKVTNEPSELAICANMKNEVKEMCIAIYAYRLRSPIAYMKNSENVEVFEAAGIKHYIVSNDEQISVTWINNNIECSVVADCQEDIFKVLESIYTSEDY